MPDPVVSVFDALDALLTRFPSLADDVTQGTVVPWLGSGISRNQVPRLEPALHKVLSFLRDQIADVTDPADEHLVALAAIIRRYLPSELPNFESDPLSWQVPTALSGLASFYSEVLGTTVGNRDADYLIWDALDVRGTYGDPSLAPGDEHLLIAALIMEGMFPELVSANWDSLIEQAATYLGGSVANLEVRITNQSFRDQPGPAHLLKLHGCAHLAYVDATTYRPYIVGTDRQIVEWTTRPEFQSVRESASDLAVNRRTLVLGLSLRDYNLRAAFALARQRMQWSWDANHPAVVFAEATLETGHQAVLGHVYREEYDSERAEVERVCRFPGFAAPLLAALYIHVMFDKLAQLLSESSVLQVPGLLPALLDGLLDLKMAIATAVPDASALAARLKPGVAVFLRTYFGLQSIAGGYLPLAFGPVNNVAARVGAVAMKSPELASALGLLGLGRSVREWDVACEEEADYVKLVISPTASRPGQTQRVIVVANEAAAEQLMNTTHWRQSAEKLTLLRVSGSRVTPRQRSPRGGLGRGRTLGRARSHAWLSDTIGSDAISTLNSFRKELAL